MYKQIIIARKDLNMSPGKLSAQVAHGSMAFLKEMVIKNMIKIAKFRYLCRRKDDSMQPYLRKDLNRLSKEAWMRGDSYFYAKPSPNGEMIECKESYNYQTEFDIDKDIMEQWLCGEFTKCVLGAKNKNQLLRAKTMAKELGLIENEDFFLIYDNCHTELTPEDDGKTLTVIGFRPMDSEIINQISKKYQLYV